jgi:hypothetical protein
MYRFQGGRKKLSQLRIQKCFPEELNEGELIICGKYNIIQRVKVEILLLIIIIDNSQ